MEQLKAHSVEDSDAADESNSSEPVQSENCSSHKAESELRGSCAGDVENLALTHPALAKAYHDIERIGKGAQGTMLRAKDANERAVAIKIFDFNRANNLKSIELFEREIHTLRNLHIKGVPEYIDTIKSDRYIYLIESYIPAPSLEKRMKNGDRYSFEQIETILIHGAQILRELASCVPPVIHRDIKPANLLVDDDLNVFLVDFGVVASIAQNSTTMTFAGTAGYLAPEQLYGRVTPAADVFGLGMTMIHLISGVSPCDINMNGTQFDLDSCVPKRIPEWFVSVLKEMTCWDTSMRLRDGQAILEDIASKKNAVILNNCSQKENTASISDLAPKGETTLTAQSESRSLEQTESMSDSQSIMIIDAKKFLKPAYDSFENRLSNYNMNIGWVPFCLVLLIFLVFLLIGFGLLGQPLSAFLSSWMPVCFPILNCFFVFGIMDEISPSAKSYIGNRVKYVEKAQVLNEICRNALLNSCQYPDLLKVDSTFMLLSHQISNPSVPLSAEYKALSAEENARLDAYLSDDTVLYPCVLYRPSLGNVDLVAPTSIIITVALLGVVLGLIPYMANLSLFWSIAYYIASVGAWSIFITDFINIFKSHKKRMTDPKNIDAYKLYVRRFLNECLAQKKQQ